MTTQRVEGLRRLARWLDTAFEIPGTGIRIGLDPLIGLVPGVGDALTGLASLYALVVAARLGAPPSVLGRMLLNVGVDALVGLVPVAGDLFDFGWRANRRNLRLVEQWLERPQATRRSSRMVVTLTVLAAIAILAAVLYSAGAVFAWAWRTVRGG